MSAPQNYQILSLCGAGRVKYAPMLTWQRSLHERVIGEEIDPILIFLMHAPTITISRRKSAAGNLLADEAGLAQAGVVTCETDRGGDITYHGPGQLVVYPIVPIVRMGMTVGSYMRFLEQWIIDSLAAWQITGERREGMTGVWVKKADGQDAKIAALGVRVRKGVAMHGVAINVTTDLSHFDLIVPCGLTNRNVASIQSLSAPKVPTLNELAETMQAVWRDAIPGEHVSVSLETAGNKSDLPPLF